MIISAKTIPVFATLLCITFSSYADDTSDFCAAIKSLPIFQPNLLRKEIDGVFAERVITEENTAKANVAALARAVSPLTLSAALTQELIENWNTNYSYYYSRSGGIYYFVNSGGSDHCPYDVWAFRDGQTLNSTAEPPDLGDSCNVLTFFGVLKGQNVLVQYGYVDRGAPPPIASDEFNEVRIVRLDRNNLDEVCIYNK